MSFRRPGSLLEPAVPASAASEAQAKVVTPAAINSDRGLGTCLSFTAAILCFNHGRVKAFRGEVVTGYHGLPTPERSGAASRYESVQ